MIQILYSKHWFFLHPSLNTPIQRTLRTNLNRAGLGSVAPYMAAAPYAPRRRPVVGAVHRIKSGHCEWAYWLDEGVTGTRSALSSAAVYNCLLDTPILPMGMNGALVSSPPRR